MHHIGYGGQREPTHIPGVTIFEFASSNIFDSSRGFPEMIQLMIMLMEFTHLHKFSLQGNVFQRGTRDTKCFERYMNKVCIMMMRRKAMN